jgi:hypothetical protein
VPAEVYVGSSLSLLLQAHDSDGLPGPLWWSSVPR